jgi:magnesium and cobalt transporter
MTTDTQEGPSPSSWLDRLGKLFTDEVQSKDDLITVLRDAKDRDLLDADVLEIMEGASQVSEMRVRDIMIPRAKMFFLEDDMNFEEALNVVVDSAHSRLPVLGEGDSEAIGILLVKDLLKLIQQSGLHSHLDWQSLVTEATFVPESKRLNVLLKDFKSSRQHMALVADEHGGIAGLVTIEDVLEQIVGDIADEHDADEDVFILSHEGGLSTVKALTPLSAFNEHFQTELSDEECDTMGGLIVKACGHVPEQGEVVILDGFRFQVLKSDGRRVHLFQVTAITDEELMAPAV